VRFAEIDLTVVSGWARKSNSRALYPVVDLELEYGDINWEGYAKSKVIGISSGYVTMGPIDELYVAIDKNYYDAAMKFTWYPYFQAFSPSQLKIQERLSRELNRRNDVINRVVTLYKSIFNERLRLQLQRQSMISRSISAELNLHQLVAELDAMTGFVYNLTDDDKIRDLTERGEVTR
jgi:hypothetical protein